MATQIYRCSRWIAGLTAAIMMAITAPGATTAHGVAFRAATPTRVRIAGVFDGHGHLNPGSRQLSFTKDTCFAGSLETDRSDAWRCFEGNFILDPCFVDQSKKFPLLLCLEAPWATEGTLLQLTQPLPSREGDHGTPGHGLPWALVLTTGQQCVLFSGATTVLGGLRLNYGCTPGKNVAVYGDVNTTRQPWTVLVWRGPGLEATRLAQLVRVAVRTVWY